MIQVTFKSRLIKIGNKLRTFEELFQISPEMVLDAFKANNNLVLSNDCRDFLLAQKRYKGICVHLVKISNYRLENQERRDHYAPITTSENLSGERYREQNPCGVLFGIRCGF